jgi:condensin complex subunit 3
MPTVSAHSSLTSSHSDELYNILRANLVERARDKESIVRVQAAVALSKLASSENQNDLDEDESSMTEILIELLQYDPSPLVSKPSTQCSLT